MTTQNELRESEPRTESVPDESVLRESGSGLRLSQAAPVVARGTGTTAGVGGVGVGVSTTGGRHDFDLIASWIAPGSRVLDLGCGDGALLERLRLERGVRGVGVDVDEAGVLSCLRRGVQVVQADIRRGLSVFADGMFDYVALSQTLQGVATPPQLMLREMLRAGRAAIVSFPNFGHWRMRMQLGLGRMPEGDRLPYHWHDTPNVRYCTIEDFERFCSERGFVAERRAFLRGDREITFAPNARADLAIYLLRGK